MAELTLPKKLEQIKATIIEIKTNPSKNVGVVSVKLTDGTNVWYKPLGISLDRGTIAWQDFKLRLQEEVKKTYEKDKALSEIKEKENVEFSLFGKGGE